MKAAYTLQGFATTFYALFAAVTYAYLGNSVTSPSFSSLETKWQKAAYGIALPNFLIAGSLYSHTASKLVFVRIFRHSKHLHSHTFLGWSTWALLILLMNGAAFVLAIGVPIFNYLIGIAASLFAAWFVSGAPIYFDIRAALTFSRRTALQACSGFTTHTTTEARTCGGGNGSRHSCA